MGGGDGGAFVAMEEDEKDRKSVKEFTHVTFNLSYLGTGAGLRLQKIYCRLWQFSASIFNNEPGEKMPGATGDNLSSGKRKRSSSDKRPSKRSRSESSEEDAQAQILFLENEIFEAKKNYNNVSKLIKILQDKDEDTDNSAVAAISLCRVFVRLMASGDMARKQSSTDKDVIVIRWLKERYSEYKTSLLLLLKQDGLESTALTLCMRLLKAEGEHLLQGKEYNFPTAFLTQIMQVILDPESNEAIRTEFGGKYVEEYDDVRFYTFRAVK